MGDYLLSSLSLPPSGRVQQSVQSRSKPASVSTPSRLSLTPLTDYRQTNLSSSVAPVIGGICNEDLPVMASANKRARTFQEDVNIQSVSRDVEEDAESTERSKYTWVKSREEESEEDEEIMVMRRGRKRSVRDRGSKRVLRSGRGGGFVRDEEEDMTSGRDGETERDLLRDRLVQLGIANLKVPEDHRLYSYITSCLLNKPMVLIPRLTSTDITALMRSQPPSCSNGTPTAGEGSSPWGQNKRPKLLVITACRLPSTRQRKLSDRSLTLDMELPASADKE